MTRIKVEVIEIYKITSLSTYTFSHFCVDFSCFFMLFYGFENSVNTAESLALGFLIYNTIAFGLQPLIGYFCDIKNNIPIAIYGCCFLILGLVLISSPWISLIICAFGNACFHIGGGIDSLMYASGKMSRSGIFVSSGALGVALGTIAGKSNTIPLIVPILLLSFCCILIICFTRSRNTQYMNIYFRNASVTQPFSLVIILCLSAVVIRSFVGSVIPIEWRTTVVLMLLPSIGSCIGKASGGYLADLFGAKNVSTITLIASIPLLVFGYRNPVFCTIGIILFNITMPITLCVVADMIPHNPGLAFGLTTLGLLCGNIPVFLLALSTFLLIPVISILIVFSAICMYISTTNKKGVFNNEKIYHSV